MEQTIAALAQTGLGGALMAIVVWFYWSQTKKLYAMNDQQRDDARADRQADREMMKGIATDFTTALKSLETNAERRTDAVCAKLDNVADRIDRLENARA